MVAQNFGIIIAKQFLAGAAALLLLAGCAVPQKQAPVSAVSELHEASIQLDRFVEVLSLIDQHNQEKGRTTDSTDKMKKLVSTFQQELTTLNEAETASEMVDHVSTSAQQLDNADAMLFARVLKLFTN